MKTVPPKLFDTSIFSSDPDDVIVDFICGQGNEGMRVTILISVGKSLDFEDIGVLGSPLIATIIPSKDVFDTSGIEIIKDDGHQEVDCIDLFEILERIHAYLCWCTRHNCGQCHTRYKYGKERVLRFCHGRILIFFYVTFCLSFDLWIIFAAFEYLDSNSDLLKSKNALKKIYPSIN